MRTIYMFENSDIKGGASVTGPNGRTYILSVENFGNCEGSQYRCVDVETGMFNCTHKPATEMAEYLTEGNYGPIDRTFYRENK